MPDHNPSAVRLAASDNVATLVRPAKAGETVAVIDGPAHRVVAREDIPFGFKIAISPIGTGEMVVKYGSPIGQATRPIDAGQLVHVHNLAGLRAGGDHRRPA